MFISIPFLFPTGLNLGCILNVVKLEVDFNFTLKAVQLLQDAFSESLISPQVNRISGVPGIVYLRLISQSFSVLV